MPATRRRAKFDPLWRLPLHAPYLGYSRARSPISPTPAQQAVRRCRSPRPCSSRSSSGRRRPGRISTCSPGTTTARPGRPRGGEATGAARAARPVEQRFAGRAADADVASRPRRAAASIRTCSAIPTRWMDNDIFGHVNNVVYYSYFDTVINQYLIEKGGLDPHGGHRSRHGGRDRLPLPPLPGLPRSRAGRPAHRSSGPLQCPLRDRHLPQRRAGRPAPTAISSTSSSSARRSGRCQFPAPIRSRAGELDPQLIAAQSIAVGERPAQPRTRRVASNGVPDLDQRGRLRINLSQREFEVEGSEEFVRSFADRISELLDLFDVDRSRRHGAPSRGRDRGSADRQARRRWARSASSCCACRPRPPMSTRCWPPDTSCRSAAPTMPSPPPTPTAA